MNSPDDKTPDFDELHEPDESEREQPVGEQPGPEADLLDFGELEDAHAARTPPGQPGAAPDFSFATAETPADPLAPLAGLSEPREEPSAEQAPDEAGEEVPAEPDAAPGLPDFMAGVPEAVSESKEAEEEALEEKGPKESLLAKLAQVNPYTVLLGIALSALTLGVLCLLLELKAYNFDWKAKAARSRAALPAAYGGPSSTTAAAWPDWVQLSDNA